MNKLMTKLFVRVTGAVSNERGAQSLEWLGLAALLIMVLGVISTYLGDQDSAITGVIDNIISEITGQIGS